MSDNKTRTTSFPRWLKRLAFILIYLASPLPVLLLHGVLPPQLDDPFMTAYSLSQIFGLLALVFMLNQLLLAGRPLALDSVLGQQWYQAFHGVGAVLVLAYAMAHRWLKVDANGFASFTEGDIQTTLGLVVLIGLILVILSALVLIQPGLPAKIPGVKGLRSWLAKGMGLGYKVLRAVHSGVTALVVLALIHAFMASSRQGAPLAWVYLGVWGCLSFGTYLVWRLRGRKASSAATRGANNV